ncbi:MAG TPA: sugar diacid recognition domain-containing protein [Anaeromyxobacteraceae bacterium]|nr:sugar diacid recognition domain-containing protein [Anaeromyxobacteraceae bacterium]
MHHDLQLLARRFLDFVYQETKLPMIVCDEQGAIVQAVDRKRIGTKHAFAQRILAGEADELFVTKADVAADPRMKEGCNTVIRIDGQAVGTFGLAGPVEVAQPLTRVAAAVLASWVHEQRQRTALESAADQVLVGVGRVSQRADGASATSTAVVELMSRASRQASERVEKTDAIVRTVHEIAQTSRILSINGSVEAARAGEHGRGFAVVAREMLELAEHARSAANQAQATLGDVHKAIAQVEEAIGRSASVARDQSAALSEVREVVRSLQEAIAKLAKT